MITARKTAGRDQETGEHRFDDSTVAFRGSEQSADLAYCATGHAGQGRTVGEGITLVAGNETKQWLYVTMSRGEDGNYVYVVTRPAKAADPAPGTRPAPEVDRHERAERERLGLRPEDPEPPADSAPAREPIGVLCDILERDGAELPALEVQRRNLANADHLGKLYAIWQGEAGPARTARYERILRQHLPEGLREEKLGSTATWLWRSLRTAEAAGLDPEQVIARAVDARSLEGARDVAAVVDFRIREQTGSMVPLGAAPWAAAQVPEIEHEERREYVAALAEAMNQRKDRLGEFAAQAAPVWAIRALGPVPEDPLDRLEWERKASDIAAYRELFGYDHPAEPIGPEPSGDAPEKRAAWHAAFQALGPVDGVDVRGEHDGRLWHMRATYQTETAWAPRYAGDELRQVRMGAQDMEQMAVRADAEAVAARERGDEETAARHETIGRSARAAETTYRTLEHQLADTMAARQEWEAATEHSRRLAIAADSELRRRHPQQRFEPLRSAEPAKPTEKEREALILPEAAEHETPQWVTGLAERNRAAREKLDEMRSLMVPSEDPEWEDEAEAWPGLVRLERDAILQPPKPEIRPAAEVLQQAQEMAAAQPAPAPSGQREASE